MRYVKKTITWILLILNIISILALILCSYAQYISPHDCPHMSILGMLLPAPLFFTILFIPIWLVFKYKYSLLSIAALIICASALRAYCPFNPFTAKPPKNALRFMSYNTYGFGYLQKSWKDNDVLNYIVNVDADILCLQEIEGFNDDSVQMILHEAYPYIMCDNEKTPLLTVLSKYPIISAEPIDYPDTYNSSCIFKVLYDNGDTIAIINNHLESYRFTRDERETFNEMVKETADYHNYGQHADTLQNGARWDESLSLLIDKLENANAKRSQQVDTLVEIINNITCPYIIVCGDFNDSPVSYAHQKLTRHLNDAYTRTGNGLGITYNRNHMYFRIDNILISENITPYKAKVDKSIRESDHYPIFCSLELQ